MKEADINQFLIKYEDLWMYISGNNMDVVCHLLNENDFYGYDFSGDKQVYQPFFGGSDDYFYGIPIGTRKLSDIDNLDEYAVYSFDLSNSKEPIKLVGNFKTYISNYLYGFIQWCDHHHGLYKRHCNQAKKVLKHLDEFSDKLIVKKYELKTNA